MEQNSNITTQRIKSTVTKENAKIMEINIEYPSLNKSENDEASKRINSFYLKLAKSYSAFCEKMAERVNTAEFLSSSMHPMGGVMKYVIPFNTSEYISIVCEISFFDGYFKRTSRLSQTWDAVKGIMLPCSYFLKREGLSVKAVKKKVGDIISQKIREERNDFSYTDKSYKKYAYNADPKNYFLCSRGIAFWYGSGTLAPSSEGFPTFVIPCKKEKSHPEGGS